MPFVTRGSTRTRVLLAVLAVVSLVVLFTTRVSRKMPDFEVYYTAAARAGAAAPLYRESDGHFQFKYLPAFAVIASPVAHVPLAAAKGAWFGLSAVLMVALLGLSVYAQPQLHRPAAVLVVLTFFAMAKFYAHELVLGQVNLLFAVLVTAAIVWLRSGREAAAGMLLALAVIVKPYAVLFAPWLATRRTRTAFAVMIAGMGVLLLVPALRYGWHGNLAELAAWWHTVTATTAPNIGNQDNVSLLASFTKWTGDAGVARSLAALAAAMLVGLGAICLRGRGDLASPDALEACLLLVLIPLLSPQGWDYVFLVSTPAVMLLINDAHLLPARLRYLTLVAIAVVALSVYDLMGRTTYAAFMALSIPTICFVIEYVALVALRFRRAA